MNTDSDLDRSLAATPHKLEVARRRGQVPRSAEAVGALVFLVAVGYLHAAGWDTLQAAFRLYRAGLAQAATGVASPSTVWPFIDAAFRGSLALLAPFLAAIVAAAVLGNLVQTGPLLALQPLAPDWNRIHPVAGLRRVFSARTLFDAARAIGKLAVLAAVVVAALLALQPQFPAIGGLAPLGQARLLLADVARLGFQIGAALAAFAVIDTIVTRRQYAKRMRMSRREWNDEHRQREGDPRIRSRLRELRRRMLQQAATLRHTRHADIVLTNPTHYAVALEYRHGTMAAPRLVAKGSGTMAAAMRAIAARHGIPVVEHRTLARTLFRSAAVGSEIPVACYRDVARLMVWLLTARAAHRHPEGARP